VFDCGSLSFDKPPGDIDPQKNIPNRGLKNPRSGKRGFFIILGRKFRGFLLDHNACGDNDEDERDFAYQGAVEGKKL